MTALTSPSMTAPSRAPRAWSNVLRDGLDIWDNRRRAETDAQLQSVRHGPCDSASQDGRQSADAQASRSVDQRVSAPRPELREDPQSIDGGESP
jgi:hypothetical protein